MIIDIEIPDKLAEQMGLSGPNGNRRALEKIVLHGYREGLLSGEQVGELLGLHFIEREQFLKDNAAHSCVTSEEHEQQVVNSKKSLSEK